MLLWYEWYKEQQGGNAQEGTGDEKVGALSDISAADVQVRDPAGGARIGNNGPYPEK